MPSFTTVLGSRIAVDSRVARKLDVNDDGDVSEHELHAASRDELLVLRGEVKEETGAAEEVADWKKFSFGRAATTAFVTVAGSALFTPFIGVPLGLLCAAGDVTSSMLSTEARNAAADGRRALNAIDARIAALK